MYRTILIEIIEAFASRYQEILYSFLAMCMKYQVNIFKFDQAHDILLLQLVSNGFLVAHHQYQTGKENNDSKDDRN